MTIRQTRRLFALASLVVPVVLVSCKAKEPPPQARTQETPPPTTAAPTTTLPSPTPVPTPPPVWRTTHWGMTKDEVLAALPGEAQKLAVPVQIGPSRPGGSSDLTIPAYEVAGVKFRVLFGFEAEALNGVHLSLSKAEFDTCSDVEKVLTEKHSAPAQRENTGTSLKGEQITWKLPDQTIILGCAGVPSLGYRSVSVDYLAPNVEVAKK
jgi:hypothetical protein